MVVQYGQYEGYQEVEPGSRKAGGFFTAASLWELACRVVPAGTSSVFSRVYQVLSNLPFIRMPWILFLGESSSLTPVTWDRWYFDLFSLLKHPSSQARS